MKHGAGLISYTEMAEVSDKLYTSKGSKVKEYELRVCTDKRGTTQWDVKFWLQSLCTGHGESSVKQM